MTSPRELVFLSQPTFVRSLSVLAPPRAVADEILATVDEMLERLETVTRAGQQHLMTKIVSALTAHPRAAASGPNGRWIAGHLADLRREAEKVAPDGPTFVAGAQRLLGFLAVSA